MTTLDNKKAFLHVIDSHRWLAASGYAWNLVCKDASGAKKDEAHGLVPNIDVMARDCFLLHARSLIKFYRSGTRYPTDILLSDFSIPGIGASLDKSLDLYEKPIEVHLLHLTDWRDVDYRKSNTLKKGTAVRPDWNKEIPVVAVKLIDECLKHASDQGGSWREPFKKLYDATANLYKTGSHGWPKELCEKSNLEKYLKSLWP